VDVEIASTRSRSRYSASSGVSRPATSESEGALDRYHLQDEDNDDDDSASIAVPVQLTKKKKISASKGKRNDALESEV
jgi:hypothetical protein